MPECGREAEYVRFHVEEAVIQPGRKFDEIRLAPVARNIVVRCPVHGEKIVQKIGNHISAKGARLPL